MKMSDIDDDKNMEKLPKIRSSHFLSFHMTQFSRVLPIF